MINRWYLTQCCFLSIWRQSLAPGLGLTLRLINLTNQRSPRRRRQYRGLRGRKQQTWSQSRPKAETRCYTQVHKSLSPVVNDFHLRSIWLQDFNEFLDFRGRHGKQLSFVIYTFCDSIHQVWNTESSECKSLRLPGPYSTSMELQQSGEVLLLQASIYLSKSSWANENRHSGPPLSHVWHGKVYLILLS